MSLRTKLIAIVVLVIGGIALYFKACHAPTTPAISTTLRSDETLKVVGTARGTLVVSRDGKGNTIVQNNAISRHGYTYTVKNDGKVEYRSKDLGNSNDFGLSTDFQSIGVGNEFLYYKDLSLLGGSHFINLRTSRLQLNLYVGVGYRIPYAKLNNISAFVGFDTDRKVIGGLFLRFGNS